MNLPFPESLNSSFRFFLTISRQMAPLFPLEVSVHKIDKGRSISSILSMTSATGSPKPLVTIVWRALRAGESDWMIWFPNKTLIKNAFHLNANVVNCFCLLNRTDEETSLLLISAHFFVLSGNRRGLIPTSIPRREGTPDHAEKCDFSNQGD